jgi:ketosteroid isomerase-like protein
MRKGLLWLLLLLQVCTYSQDGPAKSLQSLVDAENSFAALSKNKDTRTAFLAYLSDSTVLFEKGVPVKDKASWQNRTANNSLLFWWPVFAGISFDGNMGFSSGPWQWSESRDAARPAAQGYYATVWQRMSGGSWKMAADIGISFPDTSPDTTVLHDASAAIYAYKQEGYQRATRKLLEHDKKYIQQLNKASASFLASYFSRDSRIERNGFRPFTPAQYGTIEEKDRSFQFHQTGGGLSESENLGYTYGTVKISTTRDGKTTTENKCFLRVWQKYPGSWKIVLDVIGGN